MPKEPDVVSGQVEDRRRPPFCYQTHDALDAIRARYLDADEKPYGKLTAALGVYLVITEAANRTGGSAARNGFQLQRKNLAALAGVTTPTLDAYVAIFEQIGVITVERQKVGDVHLPNVWILTEPEGVRERPPRQAHLPTRKADAPLHARSLPESKKRTEEEANASSSPSREIAVPDVGRPAVRKRNLPFDALVEVCPGIDPKIDSGQVAAALKMIRRRLGSEADTPHPRGDPARACLGADEDPLANVVLANEIRRRARLYHERWEEVDISPTALSKNWTKLLTDKPKGARMRPSEIATMFDRT